MSTHTHGHNGESWSNPDACTRCEKLMRDIKRLRADRNALLVRLYDLEHGAEAARPDTAELPDLPDLPGLPELPELPKMARTPRIPPPNQGRSFPLQTATPRRRHSRPPFEAARFEGAPLAFTEPERVPAGRQWGPGSTAVGGVMSRDQGLDFGAVSRLSPEELDDLPYGLITLDAEGRVVHYNDTEARLAGLPPERVIGRNFFEEIAPCTRVRAFEGRFRTLARDPTAVRVQSFDFAFGFAHSEQHVSIVMTPARRRGQFNLALVRRSIKAR